jgi:hypothetical protein
MANQRRSQPIRNGETRTLVCQITWPSGPVWATATSSARKDILSCFSSLWKTWDAAMAAAHRQNDTAIRLARRADARDRVLANFERLYQDRSVTGQPVNVPPPTDPETSN